MIQFLIKPLIDGMDTNCNISDLVTIRNLLVRLAVIKFWRDDWAKHQGTTVKDFSVYI